MEVSKQVNRTTYSVQRKHQESSAQESGPAISGQSNEANKSPTPSKIQNFKELRVWVDGMTLVKEIYKVTERFPQKEFYGLTSQLRRCVISVPSNIAEGFRRNHLKEFQQFLHIALGSLAEAETQILIAGDLGYLSDVEEKPLLELVEKINRMAINLRKKLIS